MSTSLRYSEWTLVGSLLLIMASLLLISRVNTSRSVALLASHPRAAELCSVAISGAVSKPGTYSVPFGTPLKKVLQKSHPNRFANLRKIDFNEKIKAPMEIELEELQEILVRIEGEVENPIDLSLSPGTRVSELKSKVLLTEGGDGSLFKSRRMLKDGEILIVRKK